MDSRLPFLLPPVLYSTSGRHNRTYARQCELAGLLCEFQWRTLHMLCNKFEIFISKHIVRSETTEGTFFTLPTSRIVCEYICYWWHSHFPNVNNVIWNMKFSIFRMLCLAVGRWSIGGCLALICTASIRGSNSEVRSEQFDGKGILHCYLNWLASPEWLV